MNKWLPGAGFKVGKPAVEQLESLCMEATERDRLRLLIGSHFPPEVMGKSAAEIRAYLIEKLSSTAPV
jgi:hypothetical protein